MITVTGTDAIEQQLEKLGNVMSTKLLRQLGNKILSNSRKRITAQTDLSGSAWQARSINSDERLQRKKMLIGLRRSMRVVSVTDSQVVIGFTGRVERIASEQQNGLQNNPYPSHLSTASRGSTRNRKDYDPALAASKRQAIELVRLGYKVKGRSVDTKWIMSHLMWDKAGVIIRIMRGNAGKTGQFLPARSFLGVNENDHQDLLKIIEDEINGIRP